MAAPIALHPPLTLDRYVVEVLMPDLVGHDRKPSAFLVYLLVEAMETERVPLGYSAVAERTGLSRRTCQDAIAHLERRGLIAVERRTDNEAARLRPLRPWIRRT